MKTIRELIDKSWDLVESDQIDGDLLPCLDDCEQEFMDAESKLNTLLPAVFLSGKDKVEQFKKELKALLVKYDAELIIEDFGKDWSSDEKIVVNFNWDEDLANRTNDGIVPDWVIGRWEDGR